MKRILFGIGALVLLIALSGVYIARRDLSESCFDGLTRSYFDRKFIGDESQHVIAQSYNCGGGTDYQMQVGAVFTKVNQAKFEAFLEKSNRDCNGCLVYEDFFLGPDMDKKHYFDYATRKYILAK